MSFHSDNAWQQSVRDRILAPWYGKHARDGRFVFLDKGRCVSLIQKRMAVDTIVQSPKNGAAICIEEKLTRHPKHRSAFTNFFLETESCTVLGHESPGWMRYAEADVLLYCFETATGDLDAYWIDFPALRKWFWGVWQNFRFHRMPHNNQTEGRLVPIDDVCGEGSVATKRFLLVAPSGEFDNAAKLVHAIGR